MRNPKGQYNNARPTDPAPLRIAAAFQMNLACGVRPDELSSRLTCRINPCPYHHTNIQKDNGSWPNVIAQRRFCLHRSAGGFLVRRQRIVAALCDGKIQVAIFQDCSRGAINTCCSHLTLRRPFREAAEERHGNGMDLSSLMNDAASSLDEHDDDLIMLTLLCRHQVWNVPTTDALNKVNAHRICDTFV